jgi:hypothetical protein
MLLHRIVLVILISVLCNLELLLLLLMIVILLVLQVRSAGSFIDNYIKKSTYFQATGSCYSYCCSFIQVASGNHQHHHHLKLRSSYHIVLQLCSHLLCVTVVSKSGGSF